MPELNKKTQGVETPETPEIEETEEGKNFSQEDLDAIAGKVRKEEREKAEKEANDKIQAAVAEAIKEAERKAKLSADEREKELLAEQAKKNEERERNNTLRENRLDAIDALIDLEIPNPKKAAEFVVDLDKDKQAEKIEAFKDIVTEIAQAMTEDKLKGDTPEAIGEQKPTQVGPSTRFEI